MAYTYSKIATYTVGSGGIGSIDFLAIPQTYTDLALKISARSANVSNFDNPRLAINTSTSTFSRRELYAESGSVGAETVSDRIIGNVPGANVTSSAFGSLDLYLPNYTSSYAKSYIVDSVTENNSTTNSMWVLAGLWNTNSPINNISITLNTAANFIQYSTFTLYGIKAEV
jgi:hypothetical protein